MLIAKGFSNWKRAKHGPRTQAKAIEHVSSKIELAEIYSQFNDDFDFYLQPILKDCHENATPEVHVDTLRRWWYVHEEWDELPYLVHKRKAALEKKMANGPKL